MRCCLQRCSHVSRRREGGSARGDGGEEEGLGLDDSDGDGERDDDDDDDRDEEEEEQEEEEEAEEEAVAVDDGRVRPDPRMKKHLNKAVKIGHKIIWGYQPRPKSRVRRHQVRAMLCVRLSEHYQGWLTLLSSPLHVTEGCRGRGQGGQEDGPGAGAGGGRRQSRGRGEQRRGGRRRRRRRRRRRLSASEPPRRHLT